MTQPREDPSIRSPAMVCHAGVAQNSAPRRGPPRVICSHNGDSKPEEPGRGRELVLERKPATKKPRMFRVVLHNDDYSTMEFVVWVLGQVFRVADSAATHLMLTIHKKGKGVAGVYTRDIAETKANEVMELAQEHGMPLLCTTESDD